MKNIPVKGFTLIELVTVIVIIGILITTAAPKFFDLGTDANKASVRNTGGAFKAGIQLARSVWIAKGASGPMDDVFVYSNNPDKSGTLDFNSNGWPAQHFVVSAKTSNPVLNNAIDCMSVWKVMFTNDTPSVSTNSTTEYKAVYVNSARCRFEFNDNPTYKIEYNSNTGDVVTTTP